MIAFPCPHCQQVIEVHARAAGQPVLVDPTATPTEIIAGICREHRVAVGEVVRPGKLALPHQLIRHIIIRELARRFPYSGDAAIARWTHVDRSTVWEVLHGRWRAAS